MKLAPDTSSMTHEELLDTVRDPERLEHAISQMQRRLHASPDTGQGWSSEPDDGSHFAYARSQWTHTLEELLAAQEELSARHQQLVDTTYELSEQRRRYSDLFARAPLAMVVTNARETIDELNDAAAALLDQSRDALQGQSWLQLIADDDRDRVRQIFEAPFEAKEPGRQVEVRLRRSDDLRPVRLVARPLGHASGTGIIVWIVEDLRAAVGAAELAQRQRDNDEFLATVGHELRGPLAAVHASLELLRTRCEPNEDATEALEVLDVHLRQVTRLVDDIVSQSRGVDATTKLRREAIDIRELIRPAVAAVRQTALARQQSVTIQLGGESLLAEVDPVRISQALHNLLDNASKYTPDHGSIAVRAWREPGELVVTVRDTGVGIPQERLDAMFSTGVQGSGVPERPRSGMGLGLPLVKRLVERHGGTIRVESPAPGNRCGTHVELRLPEVQPQRQSPAPSSTSTTAKKSWVARIMLVEDNVDLSKSLGELLRRNGHEVEHTNDGSEALTLCERFTPDVVICDIGLPGSLDGYAVARRLRQLHPAAKLIAASGRTERSDAADLFDAHLLKPYSIREVHQALADLESE